MTFSDRDIERLAMIAQGDQWDASRTETLDQIKRLVAEAVPSFTLDESDIYLNCALNDYGETFLSEEPGHATPTHNPLHFDEETGAAWLEEGFITFLASWDWRAHGYRSDPRLS